MYADYRRAIGAADVARARGAARIEFDQNFAASYEVHTIKPKRGIA